MKLRYASTLLVAPAILLLGTTTSFADSNQATNQNSQNDISNSAITTTQVGTSTNASTSSAAPSPQVATTTTSSATLATVATPVTSATTVTAAPASAASDSPSLDQPTSVTDATTNPASLPFVSFVSNYYTATQTANATYIYNYFINQGWTSQATAGMLGNMVAESGLKPDQWEIGGGGGYGLVQWTPATAMQNWCNSNGYNYASLAGQCAYIQYQMTHGLQFYPSSYSAMTASQYMHSTQSAYNLAMIFNANFERPAVAYQPARGDYATYWYNYFANGSHQSIGDGTATQPSDSGVFKQSGQFTVTYGYGMNIRSAASTSAPIVASYSNGQSFSYDQKIKADGYLWASYVSYSGPRRYVAIERLSDGFKFGNDSNNFDFQNNSSSTGGTGAPSTGGNTSTQSGSVKQSGQFTITYSAGMNVRSGASTSAAIVGGLGQGQSIYYDEKIQNNGYLWIGYTAYSGARRYIAIKNLTNGQTFGNDSNNFSYPASSGTGAPVDQGSSSTSVSKADQIVNLARQQLGKPYQYGATGPNAFDCSGLVQYVYGQVGISLPRTTYQQENCGYEVSLNNLQAGDLLFWGNRGQAYHVAIYTGNGNMLYAPEPGQNVKEIQMKYWMPSFARRVL